MQLVVAIETTLAFLRSLEQFEDHGESRPVGQAAVCTKNLNPDVVMVKPAEDGL